MKTIFLIIALWCVGLVIDTVMTGSLFGISSSALLVLSLIICIFWEPDYAYIVAVIFGVTVDSFSTIGFGIYGLSFFLIALLFCFLLQYIEKTYFFLTVLVGLMLLVYKFLLIAIRVLTQNNFIAIDYFNSNNLEGIFIEMGLNIFLFVFFLSLCRKLQNRFNFF